MDFDNFAYMDAIENAFYYQLTELIDYLDSCGIAEAKKLLPYFELMRVYADKLMELKNGSQDICYHIQRHAQSKTQDQYFIDEITKFIAQHPIITHENIQNIEQIQSEAEQALFVIKKAKEKALLRME